MKTLTELIIEYGDIYEDSYSDFEGDVYGETMDGDMVLIGHVETDAN